jgi:hypothetical protein
MIILTIRTSYVKGRRKLIESCLESLISCRRKYKMKFIVRKLDFKIKVQIKVIKMSKVIRNKRFWKNWKDCI